MLVRIQATRRNNCFLLWYRFPVTEQTMQEALEDGRSQYYACPFKQDPSYHDWRVEMCEYDLDEHGQPINIRVTSTLPIEAQE